MSFRFRCIFVQIHFVVSTKCAAAVREIHVANTLSDHVQHSILYWNWPLLCTNLQSEEKQHKENIQMQLFQLFALNSDENGKNFCSFIFIFLSFVFLCYATFHWFRMECAVNHLPMPNRLRRLCDFFFFGLRHVFATFSPLLIFLIYTLFTWPARRPIKITFENNYL